MRSAALLVLVLLLGAAAFAFGSVEPWAEEGLRLGALIVFALTFWKRPAGAWRHRAVAALLLPGVLLVLWAALQLVPLPRSVVAALAPQTAALYRDAVPIPYGGTSLAPWLLSRASGDGFRVQPGATAPAGLADGGDRTVGRTLSIHPAATRRAVLQWTTMLLLFLVAAELASDPVRRYRLLWGVATWAGILGLVAVLQSVAWNGRVLWLRAPPPDADTLGPFINRNHFAGFVEMGTLIAIGLLLAILARAEGRLSLSGVRASLRDREWAVPRALAVSLLVVLGVGGVVLSRSRGGMLALGFGIVLLALVGARRTRSWLPFAALAVALLGLGAGLAVWVAPADTGMSEVPFVSSGADPSMSYRFDAYAKTLRILLDHPLTGTGLGTFEWAYARYERQGEWMSMLQAHNDYLQLASESGLPGVALLLWALIAFGWRVLRPALGSSSAPRWTSAAAGAAALAMLLHSVIDFGLQVPAVAALFSVLLGVLVAAANDRAAAAPAAEPVEKVA